MHVTNNTSCKISQTGIAGKQSVFPFAWLINQFGEVPRKANFIATDI